jgi:CRP/FNR family transcriptional regulator, cyclic AMP receptor protein
MDGLKPLLEEHPFFAGMTSDDLALIAGCARNARFAPGEYLCREGSAAREFYLVRSGSVSLELHAPGRGTLILQTIGEGEILGFSWLMPPHVWMFDGRASQATQVLAFDGACLRGKCEEDPRLGYDLMKRVARVMIERLQSLRLQLADVFGGPTARSRGAG